MFSTSDSETYLSVANWIGGYDTIYTETRPILYPFLLFICSKLNLVYCVWFTQFLFWLSSANFIYNSVKLLTKKKIIAVLASLTFVLNLSLIAMTLHGLTEVITVFGLTWFFYFFVSNINNRRELRFIHLVLLFFSLLTIIKPVFYIPFLGITFIIVPIFYLKKYITNPFKIISLLLVISPVIFQLSLMKKQHNQFTISTIGHTTFTKYFVAQAIETKEGISRVISIEKALQLKDTEKTKFIMNNKMLFLSLFKKNLKENIAAKSTFLQYPKEYVNPKFALFMKRSNKVFYYFHQIMFFFVLIVLYTLFKSKDYTSLLIVLFIYGLLFYYIIVTGISFSQGDRLVSPAISLWICLYTFVIYKLNEFFTNKYKLNIK